MNCENCVLDKFKDECGLIGISGADEEELSTLLYFGLISLQHRGQEAAGMAVVQNNHIEYYRDTGLAQEVFTEKRLKRLSGKIGLAHVRYSTSGSSSFLNAQPVVVRARGGMIAVAHNGNIVNAKVIRDELQSEGMMFHSSLDTEVMTGLIAKYIAEDKDILAAISTALSRCQGSFSLAMIIDGKLVAARDKFGMRPLSLGRLPNGGYVVASETCAFHVCGATFERDIEPGEILIIDGDKLYSRIYEKAPKRAMCSFEYVYFAMPESTIEGRNVFLARKEAGKIMYRENPTEADMVIAVPDSGIAAAIGYAEESGIPFDLGMIKNKYLGRSFIQPSQALRELAVKLKLNVIRENVEGKRIILIDDSIVRGTTMKKLLNMLREAGAKEIHVRICSPPVTHPCYFGIDTPERKHLAAAKYSEEEIRKMIGADTLSFISAKGVIDSVGLGEDCLCLGCFDGKYPVDVPEHVCKLMLEEN